MKLLIALLLLIKLPFMIHAQSSVVDLFIGTYTKSDNSKGIYVYDFDVSEGKAEYRSVAETENPSFLTLSTNRKFVYTTNENGDGEGAVSAFSYNPATKKLSFMNKQLTGGDHPCHIVTDRKGTHLIASNYSGGSLSVFPILADGRVGPMKQLIQYEGSGPDKRRQTSPHVHSAFFSPDEKHLYVQDLGTDQIVIYDYHPENESNPLVPAAQPFLMGGPGGGPRLIALSAQGQFIYLIQEMTANVMVYQQLGGQWESIQELSANEAGFTGVNGAADIKLSPDGKFLYASNRGEAHTLAIFRVDGSTGRLTKVGNQSTLGKTPRSLTITPDGNYLLVANQETNEIVVFERSADTGLLRDTGNRIAVGTPVCLVF